MAIDFNDLQNQTLWNLQQSELVNFGAAPNYGTAQNPAIPQTALQFLINRAYARVLADLSDIGLTIASATFTSVANQSDYSFPPNGQPAFQRIIRVQYNPVGQPWTQEMEGGIRLISWAEFNRWSAFGYLRPFTYNIIPDVVSVPPTRDKIAFFPGTASTGDTITVDYIPELTVGTTYAPLANGTDVPNLPDPAQDLIPLWATSLCWPKLREMGEVSEWRQYYGAELLRVRDQLRQTSLGDTQRIRDAEAGLAASYPIGGVLSLP